MRDPIGAIREAAAQVEQVLAGHCAESFACDVHVRDAISGPLRAIAEAAAAVPEAEASKRPEIPWDRLRAIEALPPPALWEVLTREVGEV